MRSIIFSLLILLIVINSCTSLTEVNSLAKKTSETLQKYKKLNYTFTSNCNDKCYQRSLTNDTLAIEMPNCNCTIEKQADKNVNILFRALNTYFKGLQKLSEDKLVALSLDR